MTYFSGTTGKRRRRAWLPEMASNAPAVKAGSARAMAEQTCSRAAGSIWLQCVASQTRADH
ncbi:MAG: hypothetical protein WCN98_00815 [Verrucomicrobiaceae bacterium]